jgi:hypothetical protein
MTTRRHPPGSVDAMGNHRIPGGLWPRLAALAITAGITLLASGCGGGSSSNPGASSSPGTSNVAKEVAYSNCMSAHGVKVSVGSNGIGSSGSGSGGASQQSFQAAQNACRHLLPNGGPSAAQIAANQSRALKQDLKYTQCMRTHGVPNFPDPTVPAGGGPVGFQVKAGTPGEAKANQACQSLLAGSGP